MKRFLSMMIVLAMTLTFVACGSKEDNQPITELTAGPTGDATDPTTEATAPTTEATEPAPTEPSQDAMVPEQPKAVSVPLTFEGEIYEDLYAVVEKLETDGRLANDNLEITLEGLCRPLTLHLSNCAVIGYTVSGQYREVFEDVQRYTHLDGFDTGMDLFQYGDAIVLNIWDGDFCYTLINTPNSFWTAYPENGRCLTVYRDREGNLIAEELATKFDSATLEQWDYTPIDRAERRDDFFYATGQCVIEGDTVTPNLTTTFTISDKYDLDALFDQAKDAGMYPEFDTLEQLLDHNYQTYHPAAPKAQSFPLIFEDMAYDTLDDLMAYLEAEGRLENTGNEITIEGLITPVTFYLDGNVLVGWGVYGYYFDVDQQALPYTQLSGNVTTDLYQYEESLVLNIWHYDAGYTLIMSPDGGWIHYPFEGRSLMVYRNDSGEMVCSQVATKFNGAVHQWDTAPLDLATSRDDFFYAEGTVVIDGNHVDYDLGEEVTISDVYDLDAMFANAKSRGYYPEFDTLDQLLEQNWQEQHIPEENSLSCESVHELP